jgi:hypothetical protein
MQPPSSLATLAETETLRRTGPFGNPDAARGFSDDEFIDIEGTIPSPLHDSEAMRRRIIVGRKGSGKSLYLRWHRRVAEDKRFIAISEATNISTHLIAHIDLIAKRDAEFVSKIGLTDYISHSSYIINFWSQIWDRALYLSIASIALSRGDTFSDIHRAEIMTKYRQLFLDDMRNERSICNVVELIHQQLAGQKNDVRRWRRYIDHPNWSLLRADLAQWCERLPPIALYVDAIDDDFEDAPQIWLHCQGGLFKTAFESVYRDDRLSNRIHLVIAVRDISYSGIVQSEHGSRYVTDYKIQHLQWDAISVRTFLHKKIQRLPSSRAAIPSADVANEPFMYWLGFESVSNKRRNIVERASDYIIRHTRMLPRDIVIMGNAICDRMEQRTREKKLLNDNPLRQRVADVSKRLASEAMRLCITELIMSADYMSEVILQNWASDMKGAEALEFLKERLSDSVKLFFSTIGKEVFSKDDLYVALSKSGLVTERHLTSERILFRFDNLLWRHGLLAVYVREGEKFRWKFHWRSMFEEPTIDADAALYGFHSSLIDLFGLKTSLEGPVF